MSGLWKEEVGVVISFSRKSQSESWRILGCSPGYKLDSLIVWRHMFKLKRQKESKDQQCAGDHRKSNPPPCASSTGLCSLAVETLCKLHNRASSEFLFKCEYTKTDSFHSNYFLCKEPPCTVLTRRFSIKIFLMHVQNFPFHFRN